MPGLTIRSLPYSARVVPLSTWKGVTRPLLLLVVGVTGAGSRIVGPWDKVMLEGVSVPLKAWRVRLCFSAICAARDVIVVLMTLELDPTLMRWLTVNWVRSGSALVLTPPLIRSTACEVVNRYLIAGPYFAASWARVSLCLF
jgi:hypothetical protein